VLKCKDLCKITKSLKVTMKLILLHYIVASSCTSLVHSSHMQYITLHVSTSMVIITCLKLLCDGNCCASIFIVVSMYRIMTDHSSCRVAFVITDNLKVLCTKFTRPLKVTMKFVLFQ
jgi:hypothetical protein